MGGALSGVEAAACGGISVAAVVYLWWCVSPTFLTATCGAITSVLGQSEKMEAQAEGWAEQFQQAMQQVQGSETLQDQAMYRAKIKTDAIESARRILDSQNLSVEMQRSYQRTIEIISRQLEIEYDLLMKPPGPS